MRSTADDYMTIAVQQACQSLREGNHGFGAVVVRDGVVVSQAHDLEESNHDPTAHAELLAIRNASVELGKDLSGCRLYSTHEPCPMCATAIVWAKIGYIGFGFGIANALAQGRTRINLGCRELFERANATIQVEEDILSAVCATLYDQRVREEIRKLRTASDQDLEGYNRATSDRRTRWVRETVLPLKSGDNSLLRAAYEILLMKLGITEEEAPIVESGRQRIVFHSQNYCPTLEACKILGLDTRKVCRIYNEGATQAMLNSIDPRLSFSRNYEKLRPYSEYCEEMITVD